MDVCIRIFLFGCPNDMCAQAMITLETASSCCQVRPSTILGQMNQQRIRSIGVLLLKLGGVALGFGFALIATFRELIAAADSPVQDDDTMSDVIRGGDLNFRTGKFDDGTDPAGWYEND